MSVFKKAMFIFLVVATFFSGSLRELMATAAQAGQVTKGNTDGREEGGGASCVGG